MRDYIPGLSQFTLYLCMMSWSCLVSRNGPFLENWPIVFQKERQSKLGRSTTFGVTTSKELRAVRGVIVWSHFYGAVRCCDFGASEVEYVGYFGV